MAEVLDIVANPRDYFLDRWNVLDVGCLCLMFVGLCVRAFDPANSTLSRSLYALSGPFAFTRILFFAQILPSQGPMIQVSRRHGDGDGGTADTHTVPWSNRPCLAMYSELSPYV